MMNTWTLKASEIRFALAGWGWGTASRTPPHLAVPRRMLQSLTRNYWRRMKAETQWVAESMIAPIPPQFIGTQQL